MPEPTGSPINSDDEKFGNGANAESTDHTTPLKSFTIEDQQAERTAAIKKVTKIAAGNTLKASKPKTKRGW